VDSRRGEKRKALIAACSFILPTKKAGAPQAEKRHVIDIVANLPGHRLFKTAEVVDA
jgi:hypothetical protein